MEGTALPAEWLWQYERNRLGFTLADAIMVPSASHAAAVSAVYGTLQPLRVVPNATRCKLCQAAKQPFTLSAGRWWDRAKNGMMLDSAASRSRYPVMMAGSLSGPNGDEFQPLHARACGSLSALDLVEMMRVAAVFASPSRYEPFGLAVLEAAMAGAALVLSDIPTFRELWDGAAVFVSADDPDAWADAMDRTISDDAERQRLAERATSRAQRFSPAYQAEGVLEAYSSAMTRSEKRLVSIA